MSSNKAILIALTFIVSALIVTTFAIVSARETASQELGQTTSASAQNLPTALPSGPVEVVRFALYDVGIYPREARVRSGLVAISIEDFSGALSQVAVERVEGTVRVPLGLVRRLTNRARAREEILLTPGHYEIFDASRRDSRAVLIVEP